MNPAMEVALISPTTLRIKSKKASLVVDPREKMPKIAADAVLILDPSSDLSRVEEYRLVVSDDGEYEAGGIKISADSKDLGRLYNLSVDDSRIVLGKVSDVEKIKDQGSEADVAILKVDSNLDENLIASLEAKYVILYGEKSQEGVKALGKDDIGATKKFSPAKEKSAEDAETKIVWLA